MANCSLSLPNCLQMRDEWAGVLDEWALRFFQEMDYTLEAYNTSTFKRQMVNLDGGWDLAAPVTAEQQLCFCRKVVVVSPTCWHSVPCYSPGTCSHISGGVLDIPATVSKSNTAALQEANLLLVVVCTWADL